jgi:hypothetical protein
MTTLPAGLVLKLPQLSKERRSFALQETCLKSLTVVSTGSMHRLYPLLARNQRELERESSNDYRTRSEWHHVIWDKLAEMGGLSS